MIARPVFCICLFAGQHMRSARGRCYEIVNLSAAGGSPIPDVDLWVRLFLAIELQSQLTQQIVKRTPFLRERWPEARWVQPRHLHLTLRFLGESNPQQQHDLVPLLQQLSRNFPAFHLELKGLGTFGGSRPPVLWAGAEVPSALAEWVQDLHDRLLTLGYPRERRPYRAHLTLARWRKHTPLGALDPKLELGSQRVSDFVLLSSRLTPSGPIYTTLGRFAGPTA